MIAYIGGKYRQAKWISSFLPEKIDNYVEIFGGAMWVYINGTVNTELAIYNDVNPFMSNLFSCCTLYNDFIKLLEEIEPQHNLLFDCYKSDILKKFHNGYSDLYDLNTAREYVYVATQVFSGIIKENSKMVDLKGKYKSKYYSFLNRLKKQTIQKKLDKLSVKNLSYEDIINSVDSTNTVMYLDPPYYGTENLYGFHGFSKKDHENLQEMIKSCKSKWILSYYEFSLLNEWFPKNKWHWEYKEYKKASMASKSKSQSVGTEILVMNF